MIGGSDKVMYTGAHSESPKNTLDEKATLGKRIRSSPLFFSYGAWLILLLVGGGLLSIQPAATMRLYIGGGLLIGGLIALGTCIPIHMCNGRHAFLSLFFSGMFTMIVVVSSYASAYSNIGLKEDKGSVSQNFWDGLYFSMTTFTTLGYGDLSIANREFRLLTSAEAFTGIVFMPITTAFFWMLITSSIPPEKLAKSCSPKPKP